MSVLFDVKDLRSGYGKIVAVDGLDIEIEAGSIVSVIGANGAGKTTALNAMMGLHPSSGNIRFSGRDISRMTAETRLQMGLALVSEKRELFGTMSVEDNLILGAFVHRRAGRSQMQRSIDRVFEIFPRLRERRTQEASTMSGGERQMLALGRALMAQPRLLMLDEPSLGLAPRIVEDMFRVISDLKGMDVSVLLVEQNARGALAISDYAYVVEVGKVVLEGDARALSADKRVIDSYLGVAMQSLDEPTGRYE